MTKPRPSETVNSQDVASLYDDFYYANCCGRPYQRDEVWLGFFGSIAERIVRDIKPATVLDAGCAMGFLVEALRARHVDASGIDISEYAIERCHPDVRPYCWVGSITDPLPQKYDLIISIEVLEHLPPAEGDRAIEILCNHTGDILFSSTPFDYKEATHFNVRPPEYWAQRFAQHGFYRDMDFDGMFITPWTMRFKKAHVPAWRIVYGYERHLWQSEKEIQACRLLNIEQNNQIAETNRQVQMLTEQVVAQEPALQKLSLDVARHQETIESMNAAFASEREEWQTALAEKVAAREQALQELAEQAARHRDAVEYLEAAIENERKQFQAALAEQLGAKDRQLKSLSLEVTRNQELAESLTAALNMKRDERVAREKLFKTIADLSIQFSRQNQESGRLMGSVASGQNALRASVEQLLDAQPASKTVISLIAQKDELIQVLSGREANLIATQSTLESEVAKLQEENEILLTAQIGSEKALRDFSAEITESRSEIARRRSRERGADLSIGALLQRRQELQEALANLSAKTAEKDSLLAAKDSQLAQQDAQLLAKNSMLAAKNERLSFIEDSVGWKIYDRIKHPYLTPAVWLYRRLTSKPPLETRQITVANHANGIKSEAVLETYFEAQESLISSMAFLTKDVHSSPSLTPHIATVDVIVCVHNALDDVMRCLDSVIRFSRNPYSLILVDDGSDAITASYLAGFAESQNAVLIRNEVAKGYTLAANQGLRQSRGPYALLLNSDTIVTPLWLDRLVACAESDPNVGIVGPLSNVASWQSIPELLHNGDWAENPLPDGLDVAGMGSIVARYSGRFYPRLPFLNGFCLMIKKQLMEQIGYFDEAAFGKGYGEENDYCLRAGKAGWSLAIADDAYVFHAQSRSYSHTRRKELSEKADYALVSKHGNDIIEKGVHKCRYDRVLEGIRARSRVTIERDQLVRQGKELWEGKRIAFILPIAAAGGGGHVVLDEADAMRKMGVEVSIINLASHRDEFGRSHPDYDIPVLYAESTAEIVDLTFGFDAVIATYCGSVYWINTNGSEDTTRQIRAYYVQDFEPHFFSPELPEFRMAWNSYTEYPDLVRFTKTKWNRNAVMEHIGVDCAIVGPSVNVDIFRPRIRRDPDWPFRPLRVAAMIRPSTPRRNARLTMEVLSEFYRTRGNTVEIIIFGCEPSDPDFLALKRDFPHLHAGKLNRRRLAFLLNEVDIFVDFSEFQAMGLTALEAMATGVGVIVPQNGGVQCFAVHEQNALIVDSSSPDACLDALQRLTLDADLRSKLQVRALADASEHYPERAAFKILATLFGNAG